MVSGLLYVMAFSHIVVKSICNSEVNDNIDNWRMQFWYKLQRWTKILCNSFKFPRVFFLNMRLNKNLCLNNCTFLQFISSFGNVVMESVSILKMLIIPRLKLKKVKGQGKEICLLFFLECCHVVILRMWKMLSKMSYILWKCWRWNGFESVEYCGRMSEINQISPLSFLWGLFTWKKWRIVVKVGNLRMLKNCYHAVLNFNCPEFC